MRQPLHNLHLMHQLGNFRLGEALQSDTLYRHSLTVVQVQRPVYGPKLSTPNTVAQLL